MMQRSIQILLVLGIIILAGCGQQNAENHVAEPEKVAVETELVEYGSLVISKNFTGTIEGIEHAELTAKLGETVERIRVKQGDKVKTGQVLLSLDKGGASSQYNQAEALYLNAKKLRDKYKNLFEEGAVSENDLDQAVTQFKIAEANFKAAKETVNIVSPIDGIITSLNVNIGDQAYLGQHLVTVSRRDSVRLDIGVDPEDIDYIDVGDIVFLSLQGISDGVVEGQVSKVAGSADPMTRAFSIEIIAANDEGTLKVGGFASAFLNLYTLENVLTVPKEAVLIVKGIPKLYKINGDTAHPIEVALGLNDGTNLEIKSGIKPGDEIVVLGQSFLSDGVLVDVVNGKAANK
jgi:RND family efflux transporter MFP subunit